METKNQIQKWTDLARKRHDEQFAAIAQILRNQIINLSTKFNFHEFIYHSIIKSESEQIVGGSLAELLSFVQSFTTFYTEEDMSHIYETYTADYLQLLITMKEFQLFAKKSDIINASIFTIENLVRIPIYCN